MLTLNRHAGLPADCFVAEYVWCHRRFWFPCWWSLYWHDNGPKHTYKTTANFIRLESEGNILSLCVIQFLPNITSMWCYEEEECWRKTTSRNEERLKKVILDEWRSTNPSYNSSSLWTEGLLLFFETSGPTTSEKHVFLLNIHPSIITSLWQFWFLHLCIEAVRVYACIKAMHLFHWWYILTFYSIHKIDLQFFCKMFFLCCDFFGCNCIHKISSSILY